MANIPLTRCQFLLPFVGILDDTGAPTSSLLARFRLPSSLIDKSDLYVPLMPAIRPVISKNSAAAVPISRPPVSGIRNGSGSTVISS